MLFCADKRAELAAAGVLPTRKGEALKVLGRAWTELPEEQKTKYRVLGEQAKKDFEAKRQAVEGNGL